MKARTVLPIVTLVLLWSQTPALAQDPTKVASRNYRTVFENASVRVLRVTVAPGSKTAVHQHPDHIVIPLTASKVRFTGADGKSEDADMAAESAIYGQATTHSGANAGTAPVDAIIVEFKTTTPGTATLPTSREGIASKVLAEGARAVAYRATAEPTFVEPAGSTHEFDQVVIALAPAQMSLAIEGKTAKTKWARGDVQFIGRGVPHESKNTGGKAADFIIVAIK